MNAAGQALTPTEGIPALVAILIAIGAIIVGGGGVGVWFSLRSSNQKNYAEARFADAQAKGEDFDRSMRLVDALDKQVTKLAERLEVAEAVACVAQGKAAAAEARAVAAEIRAQAAESASERERIECDRKLQAQSDKIDALQARIVQLERN